LYVGDLFQLRIHQEKSRTAVAFGVPLVIMFLGMGLVSLVT